MLEKRDILDWDENDIQTLKNVMMEQTVLFDLDETDDVYGRDIHQAVKEIAQGCNYLQCMLEECNGDTFTQCVEEVSPND